MFHLQFLQSTRISFSYDFLGQHFLCPYPILVTVILLSRAGNKLGFSWGYKPNWTELERKEKESKLCKITGLSGLFHLWSCSSYWRSLQLGMILCPMFMLVKLGFKLLSTSFSSLGNDYISCSFTQHEKNFLKIVYLYYLIVFGSLLITFFSIGYFREECTSKGSWRELEIEK